MLRLLLLYIALIAPGTTLAQDPDADGAGTDSVDGTGLQSVDGSGTDSVDGTGIQSVDGTGLNSADSTAPRSVDGTGLRSVDGTGLQSVDGTGIQSVDGTASAAGSAVQSYTIQAGDTLGSIAQQFYGDADAWQQIFDANSGVLSDPDDIPVGTTISIPGA